MIIDVGQQLLESMGYTVFPVKAAEKQLKRTRRTRKTTAITLSQARSFFKQVVTTRYWNAMQGGVHA